MSPKGKPPEYLHLLNVSKEIKIPVLLKKMAVNSALEIQERRKRCGNILTGIDYTLPHSVTLYDMKIRYSPTFCVRCSKDESSKKASIEIGLYPRDKIKV